MPYKDLKVRKEFMQRYAKKNKKKLKNYIKAYQKQNPQTTWKAAIKYKYGITDEQYQVMLQEQNGVCAICKQISKRKDRIINLSIDHNHKTGRIRGLLCTQCNQGLGSFKDSKEQLKAAISYLEQYNE